MEVTKDGALCSACVPSIASILEAADRIDESARRLSEVMEIEDPHHTIDAAKTSAAIAAGQAAAAAAQLRALAAIAARLGARHSFVLPEGSEVVALGDRLHIVARAGKA